jgi:glycosyltransferase involved in cell wall biosynthesis
MSAPAAALATGRPAVTVVIPSYKHGHYLGECLASLVEQTWPDWEAVVVDDASPDRELVESVIAELGDRRVRLVHHERNAGLAASRNTGIRAAGAELVLPLDADDKLAPAALETLHAALAADQTLDGAYADVQLFGRAHDVLAFPGPANGRLLHIADTIPGAGTMIRRALWERLGGYDESEALRSGREDFEFWMRAFARGLKVRRIATPLYLYRVSHTSMSLACRREDHLVTAYMADKHAALFADEGERRRFLARGYARAALARHESGERAAAWSLAWKAARNEPSAANLRLLARCALSPETARRVTTGELRRLVPLASYPLRGRRRYAPFFIIGAARSGTTLLRRVLTAHSELHIPPETFVLGELIRGFRRWGRGLTWSELVSLVLSRFELHPEFHTFDLWLGPLAARLASVPAADRNLAHLIDGFYRFHAEQHALASKSRWGDKTPLNTLEPGTLEGLLEVFPDARFIHLVRDGCDVVYSHLSGGFMRDRREAAERWVEMASRARRFAAAHADRSIEIRYESLVADPAATVERLCAFLGVEPEPAMLGSEASASDLGDVPAWYWHEEVGRPIHAGNVGKGRRYFSAEERADLERVIGPELAAYGYPPADTPPGDLPDDDADG